MAADHRLDLGDAPALEPDVVLFQRLAAGDQDEALTLCDRLAVFNDGRIEQVGKARDVYENPANRFVADFVGTSNVLDGAAAEALIGRPGMFVIRPERIGVVPPGTDPAQGVHTVDATVSEVIYAGPNTVVSGNTDPANELVPLPPVQVPSVPSLGVANVKKKTLVLGPGDHGDSHPPYPATAPGRHGRLRWQS